ncbi:MAG: 6-phosphogluconolactonase [Pseudomonadales bacterium]|nr:6-phosphogluconolactonase [Pseudomonadales bacterium]
MTMSKIRLYQYDQIETLLTALVHEIEACIKKLTATQDRFDIAFSGGKSPIPLFKRLAESATIPWDRAFVHLIDERWVPPSSPDSNERLVKTELIDRINSNVTFEGMFNSHTDCDKAMKTLSIDPPRMDLAILGMGLDGHTASIFPSSNEYETLISTTNSYGTCQPFHAPHERATMTLAGLLQVETLFLYIPGKEKMDKFNEIQKDDSLKSPLQHLLNKRKRALQVFTCD